ncbi:plastocyanin [Pseudoflavitalea sp. X16]|nr:plastocyanin [Paraflavitalea devenefica]
MVLLMATLMAACSKDKDNGNGNNNSPTVFMKNSVFSNTNLQVVSGTTVIWKNDDTMVHTVTADNNSFDSGDMQPGASYSRTFNSTGTIAYHCRHHLGMTAVIVVVAGN